MLQVEAAGKVFSKYNGNDDKILLFTKCSRPRGKEDNLLFTWQSCSKWYGDFIDYRQNSTIYYER
ncbi:hypothetical protein SAMN05421736_11389 [Evansella caseinilytica]|uniref:Uncharacterized protein n=1 Tax=Evansella caseinilytica TaxID=1503961 RepID=A0A1H3T786_9BACI|nr:hypothetical protein SAMN05421736_11389 [Evansella caseinilytica]